MTTSFSHNTDRTTLQHRPEQQDQGAERVIHQITNEDRRAAYGRQDTDLRRSSAHESLPGLELTDSSSSDCGRNLIPDSVRRRNNEQILDRVAQNPRTDLGAMLNDMFRNRGGEPRGLGVQYLTDDFSANQIMTPYTTNALAMVATSRNQTQGVTNRLDANGRLGYGERIEPGTTYAVESYDSRSRTVFVRNPRHRDQLESMPLSTFRENFATFNSYILR